MMQDFRELRAWKAAHELTLAVYRVTKGFPREEIYGLTSQIRRSAASVAANIAEGRNRATDLDFARFVQVALGSAAETEYHLILARDLDYLPIAEYERLAALANDVKRMLTGLLDVLQAEGGRRKAEGDR